MRIIAAIIFGGCWVLAAGLPICSDSYLADCFAQASASNQTAHKFDEFKYTTAEDEHARLGRFAAELKQQPGARGVIIAYGGRLFRAGIDPGVISRAAMARGYLAYVRGINFNRIITINGGLREQETVELWLMPPGASIPSPSPSLPREAEIYCPYLQVSGSAYIWAGKKSLTFVAHFIDETTKAQPRFNWSTSGGEIVNGQGTHSISVQLGETDYQSIAATVEVSGYSSECQLARSARSPVALTQMPHRYYEYGDLGCDTENAILYDFAMTLHREPELRGFIIYYGGHRFRGRLPLQGEAEALANRAKLYLVDIGRIDPTRLTLVNGGFREEWTAELWINTLNGKEPVASPTIPLKEIKFRNGKLKKQILSCKGIY